VPFFVHLVPPVWACEYEGVGEAVPCDRAGKDCAEVRGQAALAREEEHQAQEEALQDGMLNSATLCCR
jgi:hypothetical protein